MKSLAKKISQTFVKNPNGVIESVPNHSIKKKKSIKDMMVDTFKNPFTYLKNGSMDNNVLARNQNINDARYTTFSSSKYDSVFNHSIDPSKFVNVPNDLMEEDIKDYPSYIYESEETINNQDNGSANEFNNQEFNNKSILVPSTKEENEKNLETINEEREGSKFAPSSIDQINRTESGYNDQSNTEKKENNRRSFFPWSFIKSKISFSRSEVSNFCNDHKLTSYERYENYNSDNETADISEDETAIELQVINNNHKPINEKYLVPEPENDKSHEFSI
ncbi:hypothetical protein H8356DRAFT_1307876 [Neocallimastix lanati (nom. inval.)]|jgi:hypothetical protein|uniref:Uncharacterized protein n=1 Tax=Neocallimastix californiae TaxID=1754190 RepID=A0A1Y2ADV0_9FUNG|nr:hypothetical protein H8356DRAFT_1307876 [Neocallimastix sp. JGI-2020a]ORY20165.1 hypothetical protein LY90DRAFT_708008 [Neocallimastix californiae]|eukprot:ORY20165.1 hypothetical protein LY90DRAFT_708008 [Neocallimastix californiae]